MAKGRPKVIGKPMVSIRVLLPEEKYEILKGLAQQELTDISTLVRRALAKAYFLPVDSNENTENKKQNN